MGGVWALKWQRSKRVSFGPKKVDMFFDLFPNVSILYTFHVKLKLFVTFKEKKGKGGKEGVVGGGMGRGRGGRWWGGAREGKGGRHSVTGWVGGA